MELTPVASNSKFNTFYRDRCAGDLVDPPTHGTNLNLTLNLNLNLNPYAMNLDQFLIINMQSESASESESESESVLNQNAMNP